MIAKLFIAVVCLTFTGTMSVMCQNDARIHLSGTVMSVKPWSNYEFDSPKERYQVMLSLQFKNLTDRTLIIFKPLSSEGAWGFWGQSRLSFIDAIGVEQPAESFPDGIQAEHMRALQMRYPSGRTYDPRTGYLTILDAPEPDTKYFALLSPGGYYQCITSIVVEKGYKTEQRTGKSPDDKFTIFVPEFRELKVRYTLSTRQWPGNADLRSARRKWKDLGELVLDSDGDYKVESASIPNILAP